jgi:hypothetical protein
MIRDFNMYNAMSSIMNYIGMPNKCVVYDCYNTPSQSFATNTSNITKANESIKARGVIGRRPMCMQESLLI